MTHTSVRCCAVIVKHDGDATTQGALLEIGQLMFESRHSKMPRCILFVIAALAIWWSHDRHCAVVVKLWGAHRVRLLCHLLTCRVTFSLRHSQWNRASADVQKWWSASHCHM